MNYNTYPQQQQQQSQYRPYMWGMATPQVRPVSSIEEVRASPIDFDGSIFYFPDVANKKIYTKRVNMDGTVSINLYELKDLTSADQFNDSSYITRQEFDMKIEELKGLITKEQEMSQTTAQPQTQIQF